MKLRGRVAHVMFEKTWNDSDVSIECEGEFLTMCAPGDLTSEFQVGQEVEVTVTAVPAERPAPRRSAREIAHEHIKACVHVDRLRWPVPHDELCDSLTAAIEADRATPPDTGERGK